MPASPARAAVGGIRPCPIARRSSSYGSWASRAADHASPRISGDRPRGHDPHWTRHSCGMQEKSTCAATCFRAHHPRISPLPVGDRQSSGDTIHNSSQAWNGEDKFGGTVVRSPGVGPRAEVKTVAARGVTTVCRAVSWRTWRSQPLSPGFFRPLDLDCEVDREHDPVANCSESQPSVASRSTARLRDKEQPYQSGRSRRPGQDPPDHLGDDDVGVAPALLAEELHRPVGSPMNGRSTQPIWMPTNT